MRPSYKEKEQEIGTQTVIIEESDQELIEVESKNPEQESFSEESVVDKSGHVNGQDQLNRVLSGEFRWFSRSCTSESAVEICTSTDSSVDNTSRKSEIGTYSNRNSSTESELP